MGGKGRPTHWGFYHQQCVKFYRVRHESISFHSSYLLTRVAAEDKSLVETGAGLDRACGYKTTPMPSPTQKLLDHRLRLQFIQLLAQTQSLISADSPEVEPFRPDLLR